MKQNQRKKVEPNQTREKGVSPQTRINKVKKGGTKGMQKQLVPLTLTPRRVCRSGGAVEERDWQGGGALVGKGVWKLKTMVGWGRGGTLAVRRVLRGGAGRG